MKNFFVDLTDQAAVPFNFGVASQQIEIFVVSVDEQNRGLAALPKSPDFHVGGAAVPANPEIAQHNQMVALAEAAVKNGFPGRDVDDSMRVSGNANGHGKTFNPERVGVLKIEPLRT